MIRYAVALLSLSCLFASSALAQDDLLARAKQQFEPIPTAPPELPGNVATPGKVELRALYADGGWAVPSQVMNVVAGRMDAV